MCFFHSFGKVDTELFFEFRSLLLLSMFILLGYYLGFFFCWSLKDKTRLSMRLAPSYIISQVFPEFLYQMKPDTFCLTVNVIKNPSFVMLAGQGGPSFFITMHARRATPDI